MPTQISPGGSTFPYYYKGGEIHCLKYGSFFTDEEALLSVMHAEEEFITQSNRQLRVWIDFYETRLTDKVLTELLRGLGRARQHIIKVAIVGCSWKDQWRLRLLGKKLGTGFPVPIRFFQDPEIAKTWLVGESD